jgi:hypothetical protein
MTAKGKRHRLILYRYIIDRFWRSVFGIGLALFAFSAAYGWLPSVLPTYTLPRVNGWILWVNGGVGMLCILVAIFLVIIKRSAYVQPFYDHLLLSTPFHKFKIPYQVVIKTSNTEMMALFNLKALKGRRRALLLSLAGKTAVVLELRGWPMPRKDFERFLSPLFFPDSTARLALIVPDWMAFSTELESYRSIWLETFHHPANTPQSDLIASFSENR